MREIDNDIIHDNLLKTKPLLAYDKPHYFDKETVFKNLNDIKGKE